MLGDRLLGTRCAGDRSWVLLAGHADRRRRCLTEKLTGWVSHEVVQRAGGAHLVAEAAQGQLQARPCGRVSSTSSTVVIARHYGGCRFRSGVHGLEQPPAGPVPLLGECHVPGAADSHAAGRTGAGHADGGRRAGRHA